MGSDNKPNPQITKWEYFSQMIMFNFLGGPKIIPANYLVNLQKGGTFVYLVYLMYLYQNFSLGAYLYLALHGSYGLLWLLKEIVFPDPKFKEKQTIGSMLGTIGVLSFYWFIGFQMMSGKGFQNPSNARVIATVLMYVFGSHLMMISDCQKYYTLKYKKGLISNGMFALTRNPNYLGEILIYLSFGALIGNWMIYGGLIFIWSVLFFSFMNAKEASLKKKEGWNEYEKRSGLILIKIFKNNILHYIFWIVFAVSMYYDYIIGGGILLLKRDK